MASGPLRAPLRSTFDYNKMANVAAGTVVVASVTSFCLEYLPHTFFLERYKKVIQMCRLGEGVPLHQNMEKLFNEVVEDLKIDQRERKFFKPFTVVGFDVQQAGIGGFRFGTIIGIPNNYLYEDKFSVDTKDIKIGYEREPLNMYHPATDNLLDSLVLSKKAKKFGIAREILMSQKQLPLYRGIESPLIIAATVGLCDFLSTSLNLYRKPRVFSFIVFGTAGFLGYSVWFQIRDTLTKYFEKSVDEELAKLGPDYVEGGKEFYEKQLKRNVALRALLGEQGAKKFNRDGDEIFFIRHKKVPLTHRKKFFSEFQFETNEPQAA